jgi:hypothetical protein
MRNMRRLQLIGAALTAIFAIGVLTAASAFAAPEFLLAEWLVGGTAVASELTTATTGEWLIEDDKAPLVGKTAALCSGILDGWMGPNSLGFVSEVLSLSGTVVGSLTSGTRLTCTNETNCSGTILVNPLGLTWEGEVELMIDGAETFFAELFAKTGGGTIGWEVECTVDGLKIVDECTTEHFVAKLLLNGAELLGEFSQAFTELAGGKLVTCSQGGEGSGVVEGSGVITRGTETITASSETSEA